MKRFVILAALGVMLLGFFGKASAQLYPNMPNMKGKTVIGGTLGGGMSGGYLNISIAPQVGYYIFNPWEVGVRGVYDLVCHFDRINGNRNAHFFGIAPYTDFQVFRGLFVHVEDEIMYGLSKWNGMTSGKWFNSFFLGGGYKQYYRERSYVYFLVLYNLSWGKLPSSTWDTPYASPLLIRVGYCF